MFILTNNFKIIFLIIFPQLIFGQIVLLDDKTKEPIPFVELSTSAKVIGYSDSLGKFEFEKKPIDTIFFNHSAYHPKYLIGEPASNYIYLKEKVIKLEEVKIKSLNNTQDIKINAKKSGKYNFSYGLYYVNLLTTEHETFSINSIAYSLYGNMKESGLIELSFYDFTDKEPGTELEEYRKIVSSSEIKNGNLIFNLTKPLIVRDKKIYLGIRLIDKVGKSLEDVKPSGLYLKYLDIPETNWWIKSSNNKKNDVWIKWNKEKALINMQPNWKIKIKY